jgi:hypothetical protein
MQQDEHQAENRHHTEEESGLSRYVNFGQILWMYAMYLLHMGQGLDGLANLLITTSSEGADGILVNTVGITHKTGSLNPKICGEYE